SGAAGRGVGASRGRRREVAGGCVSGRAPRGSVRGRWCCGRRRAVRGSRRAGRRRAGPAPGDRGGPRGGWIRCGGGRRVRWTGGAVAQVADRLRWAGTSGSRRVRDANVTGEPERVDMGSGAMSATDSTGRRGAEPAWAREAERTAGVEIVPGRAYGFFTDTTLCIGCKACEVACKQWNNLPAEGFHFTGVSYDNTRALSATTWRHVRFIEQFDERDPGDVGPAAAGVGDRARRRDGAAAFGGDRTLSPAGGGRMTEREDGASDGAGDRAGPVAYRQTAVGDRDAGPPMPDFPTGFEPWGHLGTDEQWAKPGARWLLMSDVCKHCVHAPCLEACPTGAIVRTDFDSVYIQHAVRHGCGYCVP